MIKTLRKIAREALLKWRIEDRYLIERKIFPKIRNKRILLVGCADYTKDYPKRLKDNKENYIWTIDIDPKVQNFGSNKHIIGNISKIRSFFPKEFFDLIFLVGVFGYGLNKKKEAEKALDDCSKIIKKEGLLVIGWSDIPNHNQTNPKKLKNFKKFKEVQAFGIPSGYRTNKNKILYFLIKR